MDLLKRLLNQLSTFWQGVSPSRRVAVAVAAAVLVGAGVLVAAIMGQPKYTPLFTRLSPEDAGAIVAKLREGNVPYQLAENGSAILVPQQTVYETRINMASQGLPKGGVVGFELFNQSNLGSTDFERKLKYNWALQGELTRTIRELSAVDDARVHIVQPDRSLFVDQSKDATASVLLKLKPGMSLSEDQIVGIANLIAGSVEGLKAENVTIVDSSGNVLSDVVANQKQPGISGQGIMAQLEVKRQIDRQLQRDLQTMLEQVFGYGKVVSRVNADVNFDLKEQTSDSYVPQNPTTGVGVLRSRQVQTERSQGMGTLAGGVPGVTSNVPGYQAQTASGGNSQYQKNDTTENYEISKVQDHTVVAPGQIKRLSVAVWVDGKLTSAQLASVKTIVASAVGFDNTRGDQLAIDSMKFDTSAFGQNQAKKATPVNPLLIWGPILLVVLLLAGGGASSS